jgi:Rrf2 family protein
MKLSTRTRYGIRAIFELALFYEKGPLQTKVIAKRQAISVKYLGQLMTTLKSFGFLRSLSGPKGGYTLAKPPDQIKLSEVFNALEGVVVTVECLEDANLCQLSADCVARELWAKVQHAIEGVLGTVTLQDLVERAKKKQTEKTGNYQI